MRSSRSANLQLVFYILSAVSKADSDKVEIRCTSATKKYLIEYSKSHVTSPPLFIRNKFIGIPIHVDKKMKDDIVCVFPSNISLHIGEIDG